MTAKRTFQSNATIRLADRDTQIFRLDAVSRAQVGEIETLPFSLRILLENLLRHEDGVTVTREDIEALASWDPVAMPSHEVAYRPARVILQDFTGVPAVVDLAAMREAYAAMGRDPKEINPVRPSDLVIDHSVQVDVYGAASAFKKNVALEYKRNRERYQFLRWGQQAFDGLRVVPPGTGIVHQVNLEYLAHVVMMREEGGVLQAFPDTLVGTDSHTTMINGLGVMGWGVGGIEAEAAMLGQPISMLIPQVVGFKLVGELPRGATATDLVLTVTQLLRARGVVGKFVEFYGEGLRDLSLPDRATIANMAPEYGATMGFFPVDGETLEYLRFTGRSREHVEAAERYAVEQGLFHDPSQPEPRFTETMQLDLGEVVPSIAGPKRPQDRIALTDASRAWRKTVTGMLDDKLDAPAAAVSRWIDEGGQPVGIAALGKGPEVTTEHGTFELRHGSVVIAAITSCTNTSNPAAMMAAGILARKANEKGLSPKPWVKTSLAPGSQVVTEYLDKANLTGELDRAGFYLVGYGCTTCIGNSGPVDDAISDAVRKHGLVVASVLSGNRNFEGRINPSVRANYLASPPLVVAYALAGTMEIDFERDPLGTSASGEPVYLKDLWPSPQEVTDAIRDAVTSEMFEKRYGQVFEGTEDWRALSVPTGDTFAWDEQSTYIRKPTFFEGLSPKYVAPGDIRGARALALLGDSVTTDHISPAGAIAPETPAGTYLQAHGVAPADFNSYGSRRGNHEVMVRGTFANIRLRNQLAPGTEGGFTRHFPDGEQTTIYDAAMQYAAEGVPLVVLAGAEYGSGSSRDWAAKGTFLLGVRAVIAASYERIHRSNLVGMGVLPLELVGGQTVESLGLTGEEVFDIEGIAGGDTAGGGISPQQELTVRADDKTFQVVARVDTPQEVEYYNHGGILQYVLRTR